MVKTDKFMVKTDKFMVSPTVKGTFFFMSVFVVSGGILNFIIAIS